MKDRKPAKRPRAVRLQNANRDDSTVARSRARMIDLRILNPGFRFAPPRALRYHLLRRLRVALLPQYRRRYQSHNQPDRQRFGERNGRMYRGLLYMAVKSFISFIFALITPVAAPEAITFSIAYFENFSAKSGMILK